MVVIVETVERLLAVLAQEAFSVKEVVLTLLLLGKVYLLVAEVAEVAAVFHLHVLFKCGLYCEIFAWFAVVAIFTE